MDGIDNHLSKNHSTQRDSLHSREENFYIVIDYKDLEVKEHLDRSYEGTLSTLGHSFYPNKQRTTCHSLQSIIYITDPCR